MFADVAVAVYPDHPKYSEYLGRELIIPLTDKRIPVIADSAVDPEFGTGALKITPGHDQNDWDIWQKHQGRQLVHDDYTLAVDHRGKLTKNTPFAGRNVTEGRLQTVAQLEKEGFIQKRDPKYSHRVGHCYRCNRTIEPLPLPQFFLKTRKMADKALAAVNAKEVRVHGAGREAILKQWLENLKDWNISRQIVWGIRLPVWYKISQQDSLAVTWIDKKGQVKPQASLNTYLKQNHSLAEIEAGIQSLLALPNAEYVVSLERPGEDYIQETDTFDTWFSSGQWPVVALKTNQPGDFEYYYPTSLMETAYDILIFWVMRMLMLGIELTGKTPFSDVYLHGLIRDEKGLKMSKSKGNVINPLSLVDKYGADALRMALVMSSAPGQDKNVGENTIKGMRNFSNKIWNSARFVSGAEIPATGKGDEEFYLKLNEVITKIDDLLEDLKPGLAAETVYNEFWHWFCDDCIERGKNGQLGKEALNFGLQTFLKLLHPFAPFVTEAIWAELSLPGLLATSDWPTVSVKLKR
jgi:valyl-tRNA synthetase